MHLDRGAPAWRAIGARLLVLFICGVGPVGSRADEPPPAAKGEWIQVTFRYGTFACDAKAPGDRIRVRYHVEIENHAQATISVDLMNFFVFQGERPLQRVQDPEPQALRPRALPAGEQMCGTLLFADAVNEHAPCDFYFELFDKFRREVRYSCPAPLRDLPTQAIPRSEEVAGGEEPVRILWQMRDSLLQDGARNETRAGVECERLAVWVDLVNATNRPRHVDSREFRLRVGEGGIPAELVPELLGKLESGLVEPRSLLAGSVMFVVPSSVSLRELDEAKLEYDSEANDPLAAAVVRAEDDRPETGIDAEGLARRSGDPTRAMRGG